MHGQDQPAAEEASNDDNRMEVDSGRAASGITTDDSEISAFERALISVRPKLSYSTCLLTGATLAGGRIRVGKRIGGGAMGTVYEAIDENEPVAIKVLNRVQEHDVYRLKTEFRTLREMHHPNVVSVYELFQEVDSWFFTMERIDGMPIHRYLESQRLQSTEPDTAQARNLALQPLLLQLFQGVAAIHAAGLVHRDLKPTNVLVSKDARLVILDFGLVSEQFSGGIGQTIDNRISGTFGYMSPEQARGATATAASDCYALGAIIRQLLGNPDPTDAVPRTPSAPSMPRTAATAVQCPVAAHDSLQELSEQLTSIQPERRPTADALVAFCQEWSNAEGVEVSPPSVVVPSSCFVGRQQELDLLRLAYREATQGFAGVTLVHGPCGMGKSLLARKLLDELVQAGVIALEGRCSEWESVPYRGLDGVMDRVSRFLLRLSIGEASYLVPRHIGAALRLFPALRRVDAFREAAERAPPEWEEPYTLRRRAIAGLRDLFYRLTERHSVVVVIEDLQWADSDTLQILSELLTPPDNPRLFVLLTARAEQDVLDDLVSKFVQVIQVRDIELGPLPLDASRVLATALLPAARTDAALLERIIVEAQGVPEYIVEFAHELRLAPSGRELNKLGDALLARIERLSPPSRELLELVSVAVRPLTLHIASDCDLSDVQESLRILLKEHLIRTDALPSGERGFDAYSEYVRKVVLHAMPEARTIKCHGALVHALESTPHVEPEWLLAHFRGAGLHERAKQFAVIVAEKALELLAYNHAATMFLVALELTQEHEETWITLNIRCAESLTMAGRGAEAAVAFVRAARAKPANEQLPLLSMAVEQWIRSGHMVEGVRLLRETLQSVGVDWPEHPATALMQLVSRRIAIRWSGLSCKPRPESEVPIDLLRKLDALRPAQTVLGTYDYLRGAAFSALALPLALRAREPRRLLIALASEAIYAAMLNGSDGSARVNQVQSQLEAFSVYAQNPIERSMPRLARAVCTYWMGRWPEVADHALCAEQLLRENVAGTLWESSLLRSIRHTLLLHRGRFDELSDELPDSLSLAVMYDDRYTHLDLLRRAASLHLRLDEVEKARQLIDQICEGRKKYGILAMDHLLMSLIVAFHLYEGDTARARSQLQERWSSCSKMGMNRFPLLRVTVAGMQADCISADTNMSTSERSRALRRLGRTVGNEQIGWSRALRDDLLGQACAYDGDSSDAIAGLTRAANEFEANGLTVCGTVARWRAKQLDHSSIAYGCEPKPLADVRNPSRWMRLVHTLF